MKNLLLLLRTLRFLRPVQVYGRLWFKLYQPRVVPVAQATARLTERQQLDYLPARQSLFIEEQSAEPVFRFLSDELLITKAADWNNPKKKKLFLYNVHYFHDLNAIGASDREAHHIRLIDRWITENPGPLGNGWEPYPLSLRIVNWVKFFSRQQHVPSHWLDSLASQALYLSKRLEHHLQGNHLFTNAKALVFAACYLTFNEPSPVQVHNKTDLHEQRKRQLQRSSVLKRHEQRRLHYLNKGLRIVSTQLGEQVLPDGGHFELSPMYHSIALEDLLDLISLSVSYPNEFSAQLKTQLRSVALTMFCWLDRMSHPDGQISLFNDSAMDIAPSAQALKSYATKLDLPPPPARFGLHYAKESGYVTVRNGALYTVLDIGRIGPDYIPGHAHADTLSFELSLHGQRVLCNSGTSVYGTGVERLRQRGTAAHNTVVIDGQNSSEVWSGFRVARRAYPDKVKVDFPPTGHSGLVVSAAHTGYQRLPGNNTHTRSWELFQHELVIVDTISGAHNSAVAYFHVHPDVVVQCDISEVRLVLSDGQTANLTPSAGAASVEACTWHPCFGESRPNKRIVIRMQSPRLVTRISWSD